MPRRRARQPLHQPRRVDRRVLRREAAPAISGPSGVPINSCACRRSSSSSRKPSSRSSATPRASAARCSSPSASPSRPARGSRRRSSSSSARRSRPRFSTVSCQTARAVSRPTRAIAPGYPLGGAGDDEAAVAPGRAPGQRLALDQGRPRPGPRQPVGRRGAQQPPADDGDLRRRRQCVGRHRPSRRRLPVRRRLPPRSPPPPTAPIRPSPAPNSPLVARRSSFVVQHQPGEPVRRHHAPAPQVVARHACAQAGPDLVGDRPGERRQFLGRDALAPCAPIAVTTSPTRASTPSGTATTVWSMQTRPRTGARRPPAASPPARRGRGGSRRRSRAAPARPASGVRRRSAGRRDAVPRSQRHHPRHPRAQRQHRPQPRRRRHLVRRREAVEGHADADEIAAGIAGARGGQRGGAVVLVDDRHGDPGGADRAHHRPEARPCASKKARSASSAVA